MVFNHHLIIDVTTELPSKAVAYPGILFKGCSTNSVEDRENGDLGAVAPWSGVLELAVIWYKKFHFI